MKISIEKRRSKQEEADTCPKEQQPRKKALNDGKQNEGTFNCRIVYSRYIESAKYNVRNRHQLEFFANLLTYS